jgi:IS5 family transposase
MLRVHLMQNWFALSDPAMEEALYEIASLRAFAGLGMESVPDETTILNFRHLLEASDLAEDIFKQVNAHLARKGLLLKRGSIVDATIIAAPSSTKNESARTRPGNAPDEEGQSVALRDEGAHRRGRGLGAGAHGDDHGGQRGRRGAGERPAARQRKRCAESSVPARSSHLGQRNHYLAPCLLLGGRNLGERSIHSCPFMLRREALHLPSLGRQTQNLHSVFNRIPLRDHVACVLEIF